MQRTSWVFTLVILGSLSLFACSDDDDGHGAAAAQCDKYVSRFCDKFAPCELITKPQCVSDLNQSFAASFGYTCAGAVRVSSTYDQCMKDIEEYVCGNPIPPTCERVILFE